MKKLSLYMHIPYCVRKCPYCNFNSYELPSRKIPTEYIDALITELKLQKRIHGKYLGNLKSIYFGGGTPSLLDENQMEKLLRSIKKIYHLKNSDKVETTLEVNPGTVDIKRLLGFHLSGINRLIIGVQSFDDGELNKLGRIHTSQESRKLLEEIRKSKIKNLGIDLIFGVPGQTVKSWLKNLETAVSFSPKHISAYNLTIEANTRYPSLMKQNSWKIAPDEEQFEMFELGSLHLKRKRFVRYEISNFAKRGYESIHNTNYWSRGTYVGIGTGAHSFIRSEQKRFWNEANPKVYMKKLADRKLPIKGYEKLSKASQNLEEIFLALRTLRGVDKRRLAQMKHHKQLSTLVNSFKGLGLLKSRGNFLGLTEKGFFVSTEITQKLANLL